MITFDVRKATFQDMPMLAVMVYRMFEEETGEVLTDAKERYIQAYIMHEFMSGSLSAAVATVMKRKKERIIGMAMFDIRVHPYGGVHAWGNHLYVDKEYRGGTVAKRLIEESEKLARECGAEEMYVETKIPALFKRRGYADSHVTLRKKL